MTPRRPIRLHAFAYSGHAHRISLALSLLGLPHETVPVDLRGGEHKRAPFLALNAFGEVPVIEDEGLVLADSNAILVYLATRYDTDRRWLPTDPVAQARVQRWLSVAAGELRSGPARARWVKAFTGQPVAPDVLALAERVLGLIDAQLQTSPWIAGEAPTIADIALYSYTAKSPDGGLDLQPHAALRAWLARVEALPGFVPMPAAPVAAP